MSEAKVKAKVKKLVLKIKQKINNELYEDLLLDIYNLEKLLGIEENEQRNKKSNKNNKKNPTTIPIDKRNPEAYIYKSPKSLEFLKNFNFKIEKKEESNKNDDNI